MTTAEMIKELCEQMNISVSELARRIGQTPQNFNKKLQRETVTLDELKAIADVLGVKFVQAFILPDGYEIKTDNNWINNILLLINNEEIWYETNQFNRTANV